MSRLAAAVLTLVCAATAAAQAPYLVSDLNTSWVPSAVSSSPDGFVGVGSYVYFAGKTEATGTELYRTNGTTIELVKDIVPGASGSSVSNIVPLTGNNFVFTACDAAHGCELWISDGTDAGTTLVKDIAPGIGGSGARPVAQLGAKVFLLANALSGYPTSLWVTDGSPAGTVLLPTYGTGGFQAVGGVMYIATSAALWRSDGTVGGTTQVRSGVYVRSLTAVGDRLMFAGETFADGIELWTSDGTTAGTVMVKDINPGANSSLSSNTTISIARAGSAVVFFAYEPTAGWSLWRSDGTEAGTVAVRAIGTNVGVTPPSLTSSGTLAWYSDSGVWRTDGTPTGTTRVGQAVSPLAFAAGPAAVYFFARTSTTGYTLWSSDGTDAGTAEVAQVTPGTPSAIAWTGGKLYFSGSDGANGSEPWVSDGTAAGTFRIANMMADPPASSNPLNLLAAGSKLFFTASTPSRHLWVTDGTAAGTVNLTAADPSIFDGYSAYAVWNGRLFFTAASGRKELWASDGTVAGTAVFASRRASQMFPSSKYLFFTDPDASYYTPDLWRTDGTQDGTVSLIDTNSASRFVEADGRVYFENGDLRGLWRTDGTPESTVRLTTNPSGDPWSSSSWISSPIAAAGGALYYALSDSARGNELRRTDLASMETTVVDIEPGTASSYPSSLTVLGNLVVFKAASAAHGQEIWRTDGTVAGTILLRDMEAGNKSSEPTLLTAANRFVFFTARTTLDGRELWRTDGTPGGTILVANIASGAGSSSPDALVAADGLIWFAADDGVSGTELWQSDGTAAGTRMVADLMPGSTGSWPRSLTVAGRRLYFTANTSAGRELWAVDLAASAFGVEAASVAEGNGGTTTLRFRVTRSGDVALAGSVVFATADGTATAGSDYVAKSGTLSFAAGATEASVDVQVTGDTLSESNEWLALEISSPTGGVIEQSRAIGTIGDDDRTVSLSIQLVLQGSSSPWAYVVTNHGPSPATGVVVRIRESPTTATLSASKCTAEGHGALRCGLGTLEPGQSETISVKRETYYYYDVYYDPSGKPGHTVVAEVSSSDVELIPADNSIAFMVDGGGKLRTPPYLVPGTTAAATYTSGTISTSERGVTVLSSNPAVVVSPAVPKIPADQQTATFALQVGNVTGVTRLSADTSSMTVPIVSSPSLARLDVAIVSDVDWWVDYGQDIVVPVRVAARHWDGAYPTGKAQLLDEAGTVLTEASLDATATTRLVLSGVMPGSYKYRVRYPGDSNFNPATVAIETIGVDALDTSMTLIAPRATCASSVEVTAIVATSYNSPIVPKGTVKVTGSTTVTGTLVPTGVVGQASVTLLVPVTSATTSISAQYVPDGPFDSDWEYEYLTTGCSSLAVSAIATGPTRVVLTWPSTGAATYEVYRTGGYGFEFRGYAATNGYVDLNVTAGKAYLYRVRPTGTTLLSPPELATTILYTDDPIVPRVTVVKAAHFTQILSAVNALRSLAGFSTFSLPEHPASGGIVKPDTISRLRTALSDARKHVGLPAAAFADAVATGVTIRAAHVQELRDATK